MTIMSENEWLSTKVIVIVVVTVLTLILLRLLYLLHRCGKPLRFSTGKPLSTLFVLGSGGHTAEMINLLSALRKDSFIPRYYIAAATDNMSLQKAQTFESSLNNEKGMEPAHYMQIYRSREVGQSYITSVGTTLIAIAHALWLMIKIRPQVILCNGPGTCIPLCAIAFVFKEVASKMEVKAMPTFLLLKDGDTAVDKLVGANPDEIKRRVESFIESTGPYVA